MARNIVEYTEQYLQLPFEPIQAAFRRRHVLREIARHRPARLLEVGCGHAPLFTDLAGMQITVVEPSSVFAANAGQLAEERCGVEVIEGYVEDLPARSGFDMIIVSCLLHEVDDPQALLAAVRRLCGPATVVHVNVPNSRSLHRLLAVAMGLMAAPGDRSDTQRRMQQRATYDTAGLTAELDRAGFVVDDRGSLFVKPFTHAQMQQLVDNGFMTPGMLDGLDRLVETLPDLGSEIWVNARLGHV